MLPPNSPSLRTRPDHRAQFARSRPIAASGRTRPDRRADHLACNTRLDSLELPSTEKTRKLMRSYTISTNPYKTNPWATARSPRLCSRCRCRRDGDWIFISRPCRSGTNGQQQKGQGIKSPGTNGNQCCCAGRRARPPFPQLSPQNVVADFLARRTLPRGRAAGRGSIWIFISRLRHNVMTPKIHRRKREFVVASDWAAFNVTSGKATPDA